MDDPKRRSGQRRVGPIRQDERRSDASEAKPDDRRTGEERRALDRRSGEERRDDDSQKVDQ